MSGPSLYLTLPDRHLFKFPPANLPPTLPPPDKERTFRAPFGISPWLYNVAMRWEVPVIFATTYVLSVIALNAYNRSNGNKPWWIARQKVFKAFVVLHNVALALYSAATFLAMLRAIVHTWPGLDNTNGLAGVADSLCKIHGPRGLGDAVTYNSSLNIWESKNQLVHISPLGLPIETDVGRLWNEGLAFWGWIFYLSKFYEVLDTFIIVAKGKRSPTLQTYHHAGAMLCMWAGIRYMSPPIWMFVFINSFIHTLMYTYFTATALNVRVSKSIKRSLTTMQIAQFVFGASYAAIHLFVKYDIPVSTPYKVASAAAAVVSHVTSAVTSATSEISHVIETPTPTASLAAVIKKYLLRAAGEEGVAERVGIARNVNQPVAEAIQSQQHSIAERAQAPVEQQYETRWRTDYTAVNCIDTSGEAFAIYLNFLYLLPLTVLFLRFFYKAYVARVRRNSSISEAAKGISKNAGKAKLNTDHAFEDAGETLEDKVARSAPEVHKEIQDLRNQLREDVKNLKDGTFNDPRVQKLEGKAKDLTDEAKTSAKNTTTKLEGKTKDLTIKAKDTIDDAAKNAEGKTRELADKATDKANDTAKSAQGKFEELADRAKNAAEDVNGQSKELADKAKDTTDDTVKIAEAKPKDIADKPKDSAKSSIPRPSSPTKRRNDERSGNLDAQSDNADASSEQDAPRGRSNESRKKDSKANTGKKANDTSTKALSTSKPTAETLKVSAQDLPKADQDAALEATSATRPPDPDSPDLSKDDSKPDDSDAMGKSGVDIDRSDVDNKQSETIGEQPDMSADVSEKSFADDPSQTMKPSGMDGKK